jgi:allantoicase
VVRLGIAGLVCGVVVDTTHFRGSAPASIGLDAIGGSPPPDELLGSEAGWEPLIGDAPVRPDHPNQIELDGSRRCTYVRLRIHPDGGVARLRVLGIALPGLWAIDPDDALPDLAGLDVGGRVEAVSDDLSPTPENVLRPGPSTGMHDGWETRRRRGDGHDWLVVRLGLPGTPRSVLVDTSHFTGNAPGSVSVDATAAAGEDHWVEIVARRPVAPHRQHLLEAARPAPAIRVRLNLYPDGGIARFRVFGTGDPPARRALRLAYLNSLFRSEAIRFFRTACGAERFWREMLEERPFVGTSQVLAAADSVFERFEAGDWTEAFAAHSRIGERADSPISAREQAGVAASPADVLERLRAGAVAYEDRSGIPFVVGTAGRSGEELLDLLHARLDADPDEERATAAAEQRTITALRLRRMLSMDERDAEDP